MVSSYLIISSEKIDRKTSSSSLLSIRTQGIALATVISSAKNRYHHPIPVAVPIPIVQHNIDNHYHLDHTHDYHHHHHYLDHHHDPWEEDYEHGHHHTDVHEFSSNHEHYH